MLSRIFQIFKGAAFSQVRKKRSILAVYATFLQNEKPMSNFGIIDAPGRLIQVFGRDLIKERDVLILISPTFLLELRRIHGQEFHQCTSYLRKYGEEYVQLGVELALCPQVLSGEISHKSTTDEGICSFLGIK